MALAVSARPPDRRRRPFPADLWRLRNVCMADERLRTRHKMETCARLGRAAPVPGVPPVCVMLGSGGITPVQQIYPGPAQLDDAGLADAYAYPDSADRSYVRANMVTSLDGAAQGTDGRSGTLSSPADKRVFALLRGLADVILVGAATARVEKYGPAEAEPAHAARRARLRQHPTPPIAVVSRRLDLDPGGPLFDPGGEQTIVLTAASAPRDRREALAEKADIVVVGEGSVDLRVALDVLAGRGLRRVLCEGGPHLLAEIVVDDLLDDLCLTFSPLLRGGDAPRALNGPPMPARRMRLAHVLEEDGTLLTRWLRADPAVPRGSADAED